MPGETASEPEAERARRRGALAGGAAAPDASTGRPERGASRTETPATRALTVYYDGACPVCVRERGRYERLARRNAHDVEWVDITSRDAELRASGIEPAAALRELHVRDAEGGVHREIDAYVLLLSRIPMLKPLAWMIGAPLVRPVLSRLYRAWVLRRLRAEGRL